MIVREKSAPENSARTSSTTCAERRVRASYIVIRTPMNIERRIELPLDEIDRGDQLTESFEREELALDRHNDRIDCRQGVDRQQSQ